MSEWVARWLGDGFMPHGQCLRWAPDVLWLNVLADAAIAAAYYTIPLALLYFVRKRRDVSFRAVFLMFGAFILACGTTHVMGVVTMWEPRYGVEGLVKLVTAALSIATAIALWKLMPQALSLPSPAQLEAANAALRKENEDRQRAEAAVRRANEELERRVEQRTRELRRSNEDLERFAHAASHDLQEPLRIIAGYTELLRRRYSGRLDADADRYIEFAASGAERMQALIRDLLSYARIDGSPLSPEPFAAGDVLAEALRNLEAAIAESGAVVESGELPDIVADRTQLTLVFQNLVSNAIRYRNEHPPRIRVAAEVRGGETVFTVSDDGIGFDDRFSETIFGPFRRLHGPERSGSGIGLATCKRILERHGGTIQATSTPGKGATFTFTLPRVAVTEPATAAGG